MKRPVKGIVSLGAATAIVVFFCSWGLPRLAQVSILEVVRQNLEKDIDATPYFYSEFEDYRISEKAIKKRRAKLR